MASPSSPTAAPSRQVLICNHNTCHQQGAERVLQAFRAEQLPAVQLEVRQCLGQCGNGPMVLILPEGIWYSHVQPQDVAAIVEQHLRRDTPLKEKLYRELHPDLVDSQNRVWGWALLGLSFLMVVTLTVMGIVWAWPSESTTIGH